ncbi:MAG: hypothetical protein ABL958_16180, partial [Bdellovibrionia bacterium]
MSAGRRFLPTLAFFILTILSATAGLAQGRPEIASVPARQHSLGPHWESIKPGLVSAIAFALEAYEGPIYFLARDMEIAYDLAITALPARDRARLKLLHVSRLSIPEDSKTYDRGKHFGQPDSKTAR